METIKIVDKNPLNKRGWKIINKEDMKDTDVVFSEESKKATIKKTTKAK